MVTLSLFHEHMPLVGQSVFSQILAKHFKSRSFLLVVPLLYGVIFKFRKAHAETSIGNKPSQPNVQPSYSISLHLKLVVKSIVLTY